MKAKLIYTLLLLAAFAITTYAWWEGLMNVGYPQGVGVALMVLCATTVVWLLRWVWDYFHNNKV